MKHRVKSISKLIESEREVLVKSSRIASRRAIRSSRASRLAIKSISNGVLIERLPDGTIRTIRKIERVASRRPGIRRGSVISIK